MTDRKKVVVIGGGFAGLQLVRKLDEKLFDILLIDKLNHHQFQPLFYQVATSQIEPANISFPFRHIFRHKKHIQIRLAEVQRILPEKNQITTTIGNFNYDYLVIATGCRTNFFGHPEICKHALTLKSTYDAISIRNHILKVFEKILSLNEEEREAYQNLVIVGAGATGVELAGAFAEIKKNVLPKDYPKINFSNFEIYLVEGSKNTLNNMSDHAKAASRKYLNRMGVNLLTERFVTGYDGQTLVLSNGEKINTKTVIWAAGVTGNYMEGLPATCAAPGNRIKVDRINKVEGLENIFAIGDIAYMGTPKYPRGHPQVANVAINQGKNLAKNLSRMMRGKKTTEYEYHDLGSMATIGEKKAVVDLPFLRFKGFLAWIIWMFLHLMLILSVRNKLIIFINWAWAYITKDSSLRLILTENKNPCHE
ncbi:MAG TPA: NAD(P)/FAD-dependent oxidoreductase [Bacteroidia bacterium]|nr:NAD(P)/FAD-dependent oxidoreductase [Bacteroidia bacterium]HRS57761.1 NAD(P)/FAD-dependent oxidoreductase [Bacteroidia bacterium]HRU67298.1 NAD(P)/FAD-dependent oxidoreductase [Bacteroidia bacterium]